MVFLVETKVPNERIEVVKRAIGFYDFATIPEIGSRGGLALLWRQEVDI